MKLMQTTWHISENEIMYTVIRYSSQKIYLIFVDNKEIHKYEASEPMNDNPIDALKSHFRNHLKKV